VAPGSTTRYLGSAGAMAEQFTGSGGTVTWTNYLVSVGGLIGMHVENVGVSTLTRYFHKEHLGSVAVITNESGTVLERLSFDAWGKRRFPNGTDDGWAPSPVRPAAASPDTRSSTRSVSCI
jgi:hypothetical protein